MEDLIKSAIIEKSNELFGFECSDSLIQFQKTKKEFEGDTTLVLFPLIKLAGKSPQEIGKVLGDFLRDELRCVSGYSIIGGFLNLSFPNSYWTQQLSDINTDAHFGMAEKNSKPEIMVEYSSPNTNKPLHLGHLRNNFLGYSVAQILAAYGHRVIKTQIINDRGIHICKSMLAWSKFSPLNEKGERENPSNTGLKGDKLVGKYYVEFDKRFNAEAKEIIAEWNAGKMEGYPEATIAKFHEFTEAKVGKEEKAIAGLDDKIKELAKNETSILREAKDLLVRWEGRDPEVYLLWTTMNGWVYDGFNQTYEKMGVDFDRLYYESDTFILGKDLVNEGLAKGVFYKKEDGSVWIDLTGEGLDHKLLLRSDGTSVYMTQDLGTAVDRFNDYPELTGIIYTVGNEQDYHFQVLFLILKKLGYSWADSCFHLSYGMVDLPSGKMKSREGTVVDADDLMDEVIESAKEMTSERGHLEGMSDADRETLYKTIGMGGLKYYLLKVDPKKRMMFNPAESIELNGHTGPFIQYTHARIQSLLRKASGFSLDPTTELGDSEKEIIKQLALYPAIIEDAAKTHAPSTVANYTYELVKLFNQFYQNVMILSETDEKQKALRLTVSQNVAKVIKSSMNLLGITVPDKM
ncbi:arginine--tRNA ligase [Fluviicola sp.]|uniref:arginine--tRNA ligase n=1 Tax=Fluviicola sp. TaxID=1917219 RepID=UPI003D2E57EF